MTSIAKLRYLRIAPRKVRLVVNLVKGKKVSEAQDILKFTRKKAADSVLKTLNSAIASAKNNSQLDESGLYISKITVDEGPKLKRWLPRAKGMATPLQKKMSHITIELDAVKGAKKVKKEAPVKKAPTPIEPEKEIAQDVDVKTPERPKYRPEYEAPKPSPKLGGISRFFRRKAI